LITDCEHDMWSSLSITSTFRKNDLRYQSRKRYLLWVDRPNGDVKVGEVHFLFSFLHLSSSPTPLLLRGNYCRQKVSDVTLYDDGLPSPWLHHLRPSFAIFCLAWPSQSTGGRGRNSTNNSLYTTSCSATFGKSDCYAYVTSRLLFTLCPGSSHLMTLWLKERLGLFYLESLTAFCGVHLTK